MNLRPAAIAGVILLASVAGAGAEPRDDALSEVMKCAGLADDHVRLICYDAAAKQAKDILASSPATQTAPAAASAAPIAQAEAPAPAGAAAAAPAQPTAKQEESWFGLSNIFGGSGSAPQTTPQQFGSESLQAPSRPANQPAPPAPLDSISASVTEVAIHFDGRFIMFLDNGQIWEQLQGDIDVAHFRKGDHPRVTISRGLLGSYNLQIQDLNKMFKVSRIK